MKKTNYSDLLYIILVVLAITAIIGVLSIFFVPRENPEEVLDGIVGDITNNETEEETDEDSADEETEENEDNTEITVTDVDFSELNYVAFGDSITYGVDGQTKKRMNSPYPTLVGNTLGLRNVLNYAVSGSTITSIEGLTNVNSQYSKSTSKADIVSVMIGVNDYARSAELGTITDTGLSTVYGGLNTLVKGLKEKYPDAYIFFMTPMPCYREEITSNATGVELVEVVSAIKEVCQKNNIPVLDLYTVGGYTMDADPYSDGIHPTQNFFVKYTAPIIAEFIKENYKGN